jgi:hypothetical protein
VISNYFGSDSTAGGIEFQFRGLKKQGRSQKEAFDSGKDPKDLVIGGGSGKGASDFLSSTLFVFTHNTF